jgi:sarcosine oxidase gamma subunit
MKEGNILFNLDHTSDTLKKAEPSKTLSGRMCTTYKEKTVEAFIEWLGQPMPTRKDGSRVKKGDRCMYLGLAVRKAIMEGKEGLAWWTPDEWTILNESRVSEEVRKAIRAKKE